MSIWHILLSGEGEMELMEQVMLGSGVVALVAVHGAGTLRDRRSTRATVVRRMERYGSERTPAARPALTAL